MPDVRTYLSNIRDFDHCSQGAQVLILGYYLHRWAGQARFGRRDISNLYAEANCAEPGSVHGVLTNERQAQRLLHDKDGYRLTARSEREIESQYPGVTSIRPSSVQASGNLRALVSKIKSPNGSHYLDEAVTCFENQCFRAAIVMSWAVCYDHLMEHILHDSTCLASCNAYLASRKMKVQSIAKREDFQELKESEVIDMCRTAKVTGKTLSKTLKQCLDIRNDYAHPSGLQVSVSKAEAYIEDIVNNAILRM